MRHRGQDGWVELRGLRSKRWYGHFFVYERNGEGREVRRHRGMCLGEKSKMSKWQAEQRLREEIKLQTKGQPTREGRTLAWFTRDRFLPMRQPQWAPSTRETNLYHVDQHILPALGEKSLCELEKFDCQVFLNRLAEKDFSLTVIDHCRTMLKAILEEAVDQDLLGKNPARKLVNPETKEPLKPVLPKADAAKLIGALELRDRLLVMIAAFCAMRPGEIFGLRWSSWRGDAFQIEGTAWRGTFRPGKAKTKGSKAPVVIPDAVMPLLNAWRESNRAAGPDALIFPSGKGTPMRPENWLRRRVKPMARTLNISTPVCFQVLRRTFATNAQGKGNSKDVQTHLRHSNIATTMDVYTEAIPESVRALVNAVTDSVMGSQKVVLQ